MAAALVSLGFTVLLFALVSDPRPRLAASNARVVASGAVLVVSPGEERCEQEQFVPADTATLRVFAGSQSQPTGESLRLSITDSDSGEVVDRRHVDGGYPLGPLDVPVESPGRDVHNGEVCIENLGSVAMAFAGHRTPMGAAVPVEESPRGDVRVPPEAGPRHEEVRIDLFRPGKESLWALAPEVARRFVLFKPGFAGRWLMWTVLAVIIAVVTAAVLFAAREPLPAAGPRAGGER